jgi:hypothetical protein
MNDDSQCANLTRDQWAWEFLRRNPDYQADYRQFIALWRALEADYGAPPHRDYPRWKRDPRAYGPLPGGGSLDHATGERCIAENDRILLECWMGAKWGFYKFPLDPHRATPPGPDELSWRPPPVSAIPADPDFRLDLSFDLSLPLPPQLEAAKFRLVGRAAELRRKGLAAPKTLANQCERWAQLLRCLDAEAEGVALGGADADSLREAQAMVHGGYLAILLIAAPAD